MPQPAEPVHVVVMDDEHVIRTLLVTALRRRGFTVSEAADGREAIAAFEALPEPVRTRSLLILDVRIPGGMGGREALAEIRKLCPSVKAIFASGLAEERELEALVEPGRTGLLTKPYNVRDLDAAVARMV